MALSTITSVTIRYGSWIETKSLEEMTKQFYNQNKDNIYCPNTNCEARIEYRSGPKLTYFRTRNSYIDGETIVEQHDSECPYAVEHDLKIANRRKYDSSILIGISDEHRDSALKRAYNKFKNLGLGKKDNSSGTTNRSKSRKRKVDDRLPLTGRLSLTTAVDEETSPKEPPLFQRSINDIGDSDFGQIRTVSGIMQDFKDAENYIYIILKNDIGKTSRILFGEYYKVNNEVQYRQLKYYSEYFSEQKLKGEQVFVACLGEITKDDFDISVVVNNYRDVYLDNHKHYEIIRKYMPL